MSDEVRTIDGQQVHGTVDNGTFFSDDGKVVVKPDGTVLHGITDPNTHQFLPNGATRTMPDGSVVYGVNSDGNFYSEDGKLLIKADGTVEHGFTDGQGYFHSARTVDGQTVYGSDTTDGGWISDDGKTAFDKDGKMVHGITDPNTHNFLPNGATHTMPDGSVVYGVNSDGNFYSEDGKLLIKADGTVEHGYTDGQGYFHSARTVDGQTVYGSDTTDGGWISDDGKTAIDKDGK
ncbi:hypothetical protein, partial [Actinoallomurus soli]|uniref:hypothetical protein n=1 Tax=Actinoallomurus soli TaxID=2952535 RepID=UPI002093CBB0